MLRVPCSNGLLSRRNLASRLAPHQSSYKVMAVVSATRVDGTEPAAAEQVDGKRSAMGRSRRRHRRDGREREIDLARGGEVLYGGGERRNQKKTINAEPAEHAELSLLRWNTRASGFVLGALCGLGVLGG
mgnify:CR=1 FL=1